MSKVQNILKNLTFVFYSHNIDLIPNFFCKLNKISEVCNHTLNLLIIHYTKITVMWYSVRVQLYPQLYSDEVHMQNNVHKILVILNDSIRKYIEKNQKIV